MQQRYRLTLPVKFRRQGHALGAIEANGLSNLGAQALETPPEGWRVVIETYKPETLLRYLAQQTPLLKWEKRVITT